MLTLHGADNVHLRTGGGKRAVGRAVLADAKQQHFRYVAEVKADAAAVRSAVLADFFPDNVCLVLKPPCVHNSKTVRKQGVGYPQIQMRFFACNICDGKRLDIIERHGFVSCQPLVLGRNLAGAVLKLPRRIGIDGIKFLTRSKPQ